MTTICRELSDVAEISRTWNTGR